MHSIALCGRSGRGLYMTVDDCDYVRMSKLKWYWHNGYAISVQHISGSPSKGDRVQRTVAAHRYVLGLRKGEGIVDHVNGDRLDNRRDNLRITSYTGNAVNRDSYGQSGYKGVRQVSTNCYVARVGAISLGCYSEASTAALAYDKAAREKYGGMARLNFPEITDYSDVARRPPRVTGERTSRVVGVSYSRTRKAKAKWRAVHQKKHIGWFLKEGDAIGALLEVKCE